MWVNVPPVRMQSAIYVEKNVCIYILICYVAAYTVPIRATETGLGHCGAYTYSVAEARNSVHYRNGSTQKGRTGRATNVQVMQTTRRPTPKAADQRAVVDGDGRPARGGGARQIEAGEGGAPGQNRMNPSGGNGRPATVRDSQRPEAAQRAPNRTESRVGDPQALVWDEAAQFDGLEKRARPRHGRHPLVREVRGRARNGQAPKLGAMPSQGH